MTTTAILGAIFTTVVAVFIFVMLRSEPVEEAPDSQTSGTPDSAEDDIERGRRNTDDPEALPEDIPHRAILIRNQITPGTLQNWLMRENLNNNRTYLENRIDQIGSHRAENIRSWADENHIIPQVDEEATDS
jgi:hypothetical protein